MQEELKEEIQLQEAEVAHCESKARPIMAILEDLKRIFIKIDFATSPFASFYDPCTFS